MYILELSGIDIGFLIAFSFLVFIIVLVTENIIVIYRYNKVCIVVTGFILIVWAFFCIILIEFKRYLYYNIGYEYSVFSSYFEEVPIFVFHIAGVLSVIYCAIVLFRLYYKLKREINVMSIKEAIENIPTGLIFMSVHGDLYLSNHSVHNLSLKMTGKILSNGEVFWDDLMSMQQEKFCVIKGESPAFMLENSEVWQFTKKHISAEKENYVELKAVNISEQFEVSQRIDDANKKLEQQQDRLKAIIEDAEENVSKEVALDVMVRLHDNLGTMLAKTNNAIYKEEINKTESIMSEWGEISSTVSDIIRPETSQKISIEQIISFANSIGCIVEIHNDGAKENLENSLILLAINETLKNAVNHSNAKYVCVHIGENIDSISIKISNENSKRISVISEGGGLSGMRKKIEKAGGFMQITCGENIVLEIMLIKNAEN